MNIQQVEAYRLSNGTIHAGSALSAVEAQERIASDALGKAVDACFKGHPHLTARHRLWIHERLESNRDEIIAALSLYVDQVETLDGEELDPEL